MAVAEGQGLPRSLRSLAMTGGVVPRSLGSAFGAIAPSPEIM
jgi:hypothetical protein